MNDDEINRKTKKRMLIVLIAGALLLIADIAASSSEGGIELVKSVDGIYMVRPDEGSQSAHLKLKATVKAGDEFFDRKFEVTLDPYSRDKPPIDEETQAVSEREQAEYEFRTLTGSFNSDTSKHRVLLPSKLRSGAEVQWEKDESSNSVIICFLTMMGAFAIYRNRYTAIKREREMQVESVMRQLPEFINRMVLLLNAGLVLSAAFERSVEDGTKFIYGKDYFCREVNSIYDSVKFANGSVGREFRNFAKRSGIRDLIRISNIINDNIHKGVELTDKLEAESRLLWVTRKKNCEERGRLAETKLTLPLVIFLMVLIVITVAPALIEL